MKWSNRTAGEAHTVYYGLDCTTGRQRPQMELPQCLFTGICHSEPNRLAERLIQTGGGRRRRATARPGTAHFARANSPNTRVLFPPPAHSHFSPALFSPPSPGLSVCFVVIQRGSAAPTVLPLQRNTSLSTWVETCIFHVLIFHLARYLYKKMILNWGIGSFA